MVNTLKKSVKKTDSVFESILQIMQIGKSDAHFDIDKERVFLSVVNQILDYYICRSDDSLKIQTVYFPICNENSQILCEEFVTLKLGLFTNNEWRDAVHNVLTIIRQRGCVIKSDETTPKVKKMAMAHYKFQVALEAILSKNIITRDTTSLLYSNHILNSYTQYKDAQKRYNRRTTNKYWYLAKAINGKYSPKEEYPLSLITEDAKAFYDSQIKIGREKGRKIENLVFFPCNSPDGDYSDFCNRIVQKSYLDNFVTVGSGLRNVFVFRFSRKPYRLRRLFDVNNLMKEKLGIHNNDDCYDFISFSYDEATLLFNQVRPVIYDVKIGENLDENYKDMITIQ